MSIQINHITVQRRIEALDTISEEQRKAFMADLSNADTNDKRAALYDRVTRAAFGAVKSHMTKTQDIPNTR